MTDNTKLIEEARTSLLPWRQELCVEMVHALKDAGQRITELEADARAEANRVMTTEHTVNVMRSDWEALRAERSALAAVIEQANALHWANESLPGRVDCGGCFAPWPCKTARALEIADTDAALRERDAEKWDEGLEAGATWPQSTPRGIPVDPPLNPYREGADRG